MVVRLVAHLRCWFLDVVTGYVVGCYVRLRCYALLPVALLYTILLPVCVGLVICCLVCYAHAVCYVGCYVVAVGWLVVRLPPALRCYVVTLRDFTFVRLVTFVWLAVTFTFPRCRVALPHALPGCYVVVPRSTFVVTVVPGCYVYVVAVADV